MLRGGSGFLLAVSAPGHTQCACDCGLVVLGAWWPEQTEVLVLRVGG